jgi:hypothetical protein
MQFLSYHCLFILFHIQLFSSKLWTYTYCKITYHVGINRSKSTMYLGIKKICRCAEECKEIGKKRQKFVQVSYSGFRILDPDPHKRIEVFLTQKNGSNL